MYNNKIVVVEIASAFPTTDSFTTHHSTKSIARSWYGEESTKFEEALCLCEAVSKLSERS